MKLLKRKIQVLLMLCFTVVFVSCEKVNISFATDGTESDPNITYLDDYATSLATYKLDSFVTSADETFCIGYHQDPVFGVVTAGSYVQLNLPASNPVANKTVFFDSLELILKPSGAFYGDSTRPLSLRVYRLNQNIKDDVNGDIYYNTTSFVYAPAAIGQSTISLNGKTGSGIHIRLLDQTGQELLSKFRTSDDEVSTQEKFINYFKGLFIAPDTSLSNSLAYFSNPADSMLVRLTYHENSLYPEKKYLDFTYTKARQFNNISFRHTNAAFSAFISKKKQVIESTLSGNKAYLNTALGSVVKISFPTLLNLKELHPYVKVVKAVLVIRPDPASYSAPYQLPGTLYLYKTDETNYQTGAVYEDATNATLQTGSLTIDNLYGKETYYSYDITSFINDKIAEGQFSKSALLLYHSTGNFDKALQRLIVNNQSGSNPVQLKLYLLGL